MNALVIFVSVMMSGVLGASIVSHYPDGGYKIETDDSSPALIHSAPVQYLTAAPAQSIIYQQAPIAQFSFKDQEQVKYIPILSHSQVHQPTGAFQLNYQSADGQSFSEKGDVKRNFENDGDVVVKTGSYAYTAPDGTPISLSYVADENGFRATGSHLPKAPIA